jgi:SAM-dependent methyltransferase
MNEQPERIPDLRVALREVYAFEFTPRVRSDTADPAHVSIVHIERSIALLSKELHGELLDVGCGQKPYADYFRHAKQLRSCDHNAVRSDLDFVCPADAIPLPDASLDGIISTEMLEHVPDPRAVWAEFARLLKPAGKVLLSTPMYWPHHEAPYDFFRYTAYGLQRLAAEAGFELLKIYPRGGTWVFVAQIIQHTIPHYLRFRWQRSLVNRLLLRIDRWRCDTRITTGWTILAQKRSGSAGASTAE